MDFVKSISGKFHSHFYLEMSNCLKSFTVKVLVENELI